MADYPLTIDKSVSSLPTALNPNKFYAVRVGQGFDLYLSDTTGSVAYKPNVSRQQITGLGTAATRDVGQNIGNLVEMTNTGFAGLGYGGLAKDITNQDLNSITVSGYYRGSNLGNRPSDIVSATTQLSVQVIATVAGAVLQYLETTSQPTRKFMRTSIGGSFGVWSEIYHTRTPIIYNTTSASAPNVVITPTGELQRASSSERYKDILGDLKLTDEQYEKTMSISPIVYRSKSPVDDPTWYFYSFSAEKLGELDKALTLWRFTEQVVDDYGNTEDVKLEEPLAEGIQLNAIVAFLHATNIKQNELINKLAKRVESLESQLTQFIG